MGKVPNCADDGYGAHHHPLLHRAIVAGRVMIIQGIGEERAQAHLCQEDVQVEVAGKTSRMHALYDWGVSVILITHAAAEGAGLDRVR
jgi:putative NIF3 family GTP cyclohydrolase 1 type 2